MMMPIILSFIVGAILIEIPLPNPIALYRPDWVAMLILYWTLKVPKRFGVVSAWVVGLVVDVLSGSLLGQHALGYILLAYLALSISQQYPLFSVLQQLMIVAVSMAAYLALMIWTTGIGGSDIELASMWLPIFATTALWHWLSKLLDRYI